MTELELFERVLWASRQRRSWIESKLSAEETRDRIKARWAAVEARRAAQLAALDRSARVRRFGTR